MDCITENNDQFQIDSRESIMCEMKLNAYKDERVIYIWEDINDKTAFIFNRMLENLCKSKGKKLPITIKLSSNGGEVLSALSMVSAIEKAIECGYEVYIYIYASCMSAAVIFASAGSKRYAQRYSRFMIHDIGSYNFGFQSKEDIKNNYEEHEALWDLVSGILLKNTKITKDYLEDIVSHQKSFFFWADEALKLGIIDELF